MSLSQPQYNALDALFVALNGPSWNWYDSYESKWNFDGDTAAPCRDRWMGVNCFCDNDSCCITNLNLGGVHARGLLPSEIQYLTNLTSLGISTNNIFGPIPAEIGALTSLMFLNIDNNAFTSIPSQISLLKSLEQFTLGSNLFDSLPPQIGDLPNLWYFSGLNNPFFGTLSSELGNLLSLKNLYLGGGEFTGSFPTELSGLTSLKDFSLQNCQFSSTFAPFLDWNTISQLELEECYFMSTVPSEIGNSASLFSVSLTYQSTVPSTVFDWTRLSTLTLHGFEGTLPTELGQMQGLRYLTIHDTIMSGPIPTEIGNLQRLSELDLNCYFTGPLPTEIGSLKSLQYFLISNSAMTGQIPSEIGALTQLIQLDLTISYFTHVPSTMTQLTELESMSLVANMFSQSLESVFPQGQFPKNLEYFDIRNNSFTGTVPSELLMLESLTEVSISSNCFHGKISCSSEDVGQNLEYIDFANLTSGFGCIGYIMKRSGEKQALNAQAGYYPLQYMTGSIPTCFWSLAELTSLDLYGNGFTGTIPDLPPLGPDQTTLTVDLSFNQLTGTLPTYNSNEYLINWMNNRISGTLPPILSFTHAEITAVSNNRLSGALPRNASLFQGVSNDEILQTLSEYVIGGNLLSFQLADIGVSDSVQNEVQYMEYNGSQLLNTSVAVASILYGLLLIAGVVYFLSATFRQSSKLVTVGKWWKRSQKIVEASELKPIRWVIGLWVVVLFASSCLYLLLKLTPSLSSKYRTHTFQYGWILSAAFLHGVAPAVLLNLILCFATIALLAGINFRGSRCNSNDGKALGISWLSMKILTIDFVLFSLNCGVMFVANAAYLGGALVFSKFLPQNDTTNAVYGSAGEFLLALVKLVWKGVMFRLSSMSKELLSSPSRDSVLFHLIVQTVSFLIIPAICVAIYSQDCFLQLFVDTYNMPFMYSYQCGSALIVKYVPVLFYAYTMSGQLRLVVMLLYMLYSKGEEQSSWLLLFNVPGVLSLRGMESNTNVIIFPSERIVSRLVLNTVIGLTFGVAYPYLGFVAVVSNVLEVVMWMLALGRYLTLTEAVGDNLENDASIVSVSSKMGEICSKHKLGSMALIEEEYRLCKENSRKELPSVAVLSVFAVFLFWGFVSFDMIADIYGTEKGLNAMIVIMVVCPVFVLTTAALWTHFAGGFGVSSSSLDSSITVHGPMMPLISKTDFQLGEDDESAQAQ